MKSLEDYCTYIIDAFLQNGYLLTVILGVSMCSGIFIAAMEAIPRK